MGWQQLKDIAEENKLAAEEEKAKPVTECPECGWPNLKENKDKDLLCPICGWRGGR